MSIANSGELYNRQLHQNEIRFVTNEKNILAFAKLKYGENPSSNNIQKARIELGQTAVALVDSAWEKMLGNKAIDKTAKEFLEANLYSVKTITKQNKSNFAENSSVALKHIDFYKNIIQPGIKTDILSILKNDIKKGVADFNKTIDKLRKQDISKTIDIASSKLINYTKNTSTVEKLTHLKDIAGKILADSIGSVIKLGYNLATSPQDLAKIYNISVEDAVSVQAILLLASASEFGGNKKDIAKNSLNLGIDKKVSIPQITNKNLRRNKPGIVSSNINNLPVIKNGESWLKGTSSNAGKVPKQIANKLNGKKFNSFNEFRNAFWKEVALDPVLSKQFPPGARTLMKDGKAPYANLNEQVGKRGVYELDHNIEIQNGGNIYDLNNIIVRTPNNHIKKTIDTKKAN